MTDPMNAILSCSCSQNLVRTKDAIGSQLPPELRARFTKVFAAYIQRYDLEGAFQHLNNRTVAAILDEYDPRDDPKPIASGEMGGLRWQLFEAPDAKKEDE